MKKIKCGHCFGSGRITTLKLKTTTCPNCNGLGSILITVDGFINQIHNLLNK